MTTPDPSTTIQIPGGMLACVLDLISGQIKATTTGDATVIINFELPIEMIQFLIAALPTPNVAGDWAIQQLTALLPQGTPIMSPPVQTAVPAQQADPANQ